MKMLTFAKRNTKEILKDPLNLAFGLGFPIVLLLLLSAIQNSIPVSLFELETLTPGITVFGYAFISLFSATLISKDRKSSFLQRLYTTPLKASDFIFGYTLPLIPLSLLQNLICYVFALILGMKFTVNIIYSILISLPVSLLFISIGLMCGSVLGDKQVGGICGALLTNLTAWLSGTWFDLNLVGGTFKKIAYVLPFVHSVEMERAVLDGYYGDVLSHFIIVCIYAVLITVIAILLFLRQMKKQ